MGKPRCTCSKKQRRRRRKKKEKDIFAPLLRTDLLKRGGDIDVIDPITPDIIPGPSPVEVNTLNRMRQLMRGDVGQGIVATANTVLKEKLPGLRINFDAGSSVRASGGSCLTSLPIVGCVLRGSYDAGLRYIEKISGSVSGTISVLSLSRNELTISIPVRLSTMDIVAQADISGSAVGINVPRIGLGGIGRPSGTMDLIIKFTKAGDGLTHRTSIKLKNISDTRIEFGSPTAVYPLNEIISTLLSPLSVAVNDLWSVSNLIAGGAISKLITNALGGTLSGVIDDQLPEVIKNGSLLLDIMDNL